MCCVASPFPARSCWAWMPAGMSSPAPTLTPLAFPPKTTRLMYASHNFAYVRDYMALGFALVFAPALALELWVWPSLVGIWAAKALYNFWRAAGGLNLVLRRFVREVEDRARLRAPRPGPA